MQQRSRSVKRTHADNRIYGVFIAILVLLLVALGVLAVLMLR